MIDCNRWGLEEAEFLFKHGENFSYPLSYSRVNENQEFIEVQTMGHSQTVAGRIDREAEVVIRECSSESLQEFQDIIGSDKFRLILRDTEDTINVVFVGCFLSNISLEFEHDVIGGVARLNLHYDLRDFMEL